jgi:hypothetical protein
MAIARETGQVGNQRVTRAREPVEQRGFPHIGAPNKGNNGFHQMLFTVKRGIEIDRPRSDAMRPLHGSV